MKPQKVIQFISAGEGARIENVRLEIVTAVMTNIIKISTERKRPNGRRDRFNSSFPSGHACGSFALTSTIDAMYGHKLGIPFPEFVGFSRLSDNERFVSDVFFGAALETAVRRAVASIHKVEDNSGLSVLQYSDGRGAGLVKGLINRESI